MSNEHRRNSRRSSLYAVTVDTGSRQIPAKVRDHSESGCRLAVSEPLRADELEIRIVRGDLKAFGTVAWSNGLNIGVSLVRKAPDGLFGPAPKVEPNDKHPVLRDHGRVRARRPGLFSPGAEHIDDRFGRLWCTGKSDPTN